MKNKLTKILIFALAIFDLLGLTSIPVFAAPNCANICDANCTVDDSVKKANGCDQNNTDKLPDVITSIINGIIAILGIIAVVFIVIGGVQYMTSTGDPSKTKKAKDTILYATIGLIICVLSFAIVNFVIKNLIGGQPTGNYTSQTDCEKAGHYWNSTTGKCN